MHLELISILTVILLLIWTQQRVIKAYLSVTTEGTTEGAMRG